MLIALTKRWKVWASAVLVAAYAFGVVAPSMVFSFNAHASIMHSLSEVHGDVLVLHFHPDDSEHASSDHAPSDRHAAKGAHHCCGVVAVPGLLPPAVIAVIDRICVPLVSLARQDRHVGCDPARLDRPPRPLPLI
jgi:hypothetical protein